MTDVQPITDLGLPNKVCDFDGSSLPIPTRRGPFPRRAIAADQQPELPTLRARLVACKRAAGHSYRLRARHRQEDFHAAVTEIDDLCALCAGRRIENARSCRMG